VSDAHIQTHRQTQTNTYKHTQTRHFVKKKILFAKQKKKYCTRGETRNKNKKILYQRGNPKQNKKYCIKGQKVSDPEKAAKESLDFTPIGYLTKFGPENPEILVRKPGDPGKVYFGTFRIPVFFSKIDFPACPGFRNTISGFSGPNLVRAPLGVKNASIFSRLFQGPKFLPFDTVFFFWRGSPSATVFFF